MTSIYEPSEPINREDLLEIKKLSSSYCRSLIMYSVQTEMLVEFLLSFRISVTLKAVYCWVENVTSYTLYNFVYMKRVVVSKKDATLLLAERCR